MTVDQLGSKYALPKLRKGTVKTEFTIMPYKYEFTARFATGLQRDLLQFYSEVCYSFTASITSCKIKRPLKCCLGSKDLRKS